MIPPRERINNVINKYQQLGGDEVKCSDVITDINTLTSELGIKVFDPILKNAEFFKTSGIGNLGTMKASSVVSDMLRTLEENVRKADIIHMERSLQKHNSSMLQDEMDQFLQQLFEE